MGNNICCLFKKKDLNLTQVDSNGNITKNCSEKEISFWTDLQNLDLVKIQTINKSKKTVCFNYSNLFIENFISISQIMEFMVEEPNFFYFLTLFEIIITITDFLQVIFILKKKYDLNKNNFFLINFERFFLMKGEDGKYSKLVYLEEKINDPYSCPEIIYKEESNTLLSSFSIMEDNTKSMQMLMTTIRGNSNSNVYKSTISVNLNSYFYSNCNDRYQKLKSNYSLEECEKFYAECISTFVTKFLLKKVTFSHAGIEREFNNFKYIFRHSLKNYFNLSNDKLQISSNINNGLSQNYESVQIFGTPTNSQDLESLKVFLCNFYLNNFEFGVLKNSIEDLLNLLPVNTKSNSINLTENILNEKIISFLKTGINLNYGECDIISESLPKAFHKIAFISDNLTNNRDCVESRKDSMRKSQNNQSQISEQKNDTGNVSVCINCVRSLIFKRSPEGRTNYISLISLKNELTKKHDFLKLDNYLKYFCSYFSTKDPFETVKDILDYRGEEIQVYLKNKYCLIFEYIHWDDYKEEVLVDDILNYDYNVKNNTKKRNNSQHDKTSILPVDKRISTNMVVDSRKSN
jgi:hypothetical protein